MGRMPYTMPRVKAGAFTASAGCVVELVCWKALSMAIHLLSPDVVSKIAAGEVVERPASVVKELIENSLDAGASQITVEVRGSGVSFVKVADNGAGIPPLEVELAFRSHATSKITSLTDLDHTTSLGFRGEALPSIAEVALVEVLTRSRDETSAVFIRLKDGAVLERSARAGNQGTVITVKQLFHNTPARLKFLKSAATENNHIVNMVTQYSLAFPEVRFVLLVDGRRVLQTPGNGKLADALVEIYGVEIARVMLEVKGGSQESGMSPLVSGYTSPSSITRATRSHLSFFVNRRWIQSRLLASAIEKAYEGWLGSGRYPISVIHLSIDPQFVDVNVHPTKREIRFSQEPIMFSAVHGAVRRALMEKSPVPELKAFTASILPETTPAMGFPRVEAPPGPLAPAMSGIVRPELPALRVLGQFASTYLIAEGPDGLYLIDQHAAHERVLYDRILAQWEQRLVEAQSLLEPMTIELNLKQEGLLKWGGDILADFGFTIEPFGDRTYLVRAVPAMLVGKPIAEALKEMVDSFEHEGATVKPEETIARSVACHGSVRAGQTLTQEEMRELVRQLEATRSPRTCPHGRPTMIHLSANRLEREFGRS